GGAGTFGLRQPVGGSGAEQSQFHAFDPPASVRPVRDLGASGRVRSRSPHRTQHQCPTGPDPPDRH
ncbi:hypothetical protein R6M67_10235, partial [Streptomyces sp. Wh19]|nr:hypothetical protein [Streptomyces sp. Wh19]